MSKSVVFLELRKVSNDFLRVIYLTGRYNILEDKSFDVWFTREYYINSMQINSLTKDNHFKLEPGISPTT